MILAITSTGNSANSLVDSRFGRCAFFAFYDTETKSLSFEENPNRNSESGAGPASVAYIAKKKSEQIISGEFGMKIRGMLDSLNIKMTSVKDEITITDIIEKFK